MLPAQIIGMTTQCPDTITIPSDAVKWRDHPDYWILYSGSVYHNNQKRNLKVDIESLTEGQTVGCMVSREDRKLHICIDGVHG